jgi:next to BRCA1 gene 1 protein
MKIKLITTLFFAVLFMNACAPAATPVPTPDVSAIYTSAAKTVIAEFTLTAASFTATPLPPTETPTLPPPTATETAPVVSIATNELGTPIELCDSLTFGTDVDVTIPDGTQMVPGQTFVKTWKIKNDGACAWGSGYGLTYAYGEKMSGKPQALVTVVQIGEVVDVSVELKAPDKVGEYTSAWQMTNPKGIPFGKALFVKIIVK